MAPKKNTEVANVASDESLAELRDEFPRDPGFSTVLFPRLTLISQDVTEESGTGKNKTIKVITAAGTFLTETPTDVINDKGSKVWEKEELGEEIEGIVIFQRKQLSYYDGSDFTSSPIYDNDDEVVPLWCNRAEVERGTPAELQQLKKYMGTNAKTGKPQSKLEEKRILYVLFKGDNEEYALYQMNVRGSSKWAFLSYVRQVSPNTVLTRFSSTAEKNGSIEWNKMKFEALRSLSEDEVDIVRDFTRQIKEGIALSKSQFGNGATAPHSELDKEFEEDDLPKLGDGK